MSSAPLGPQFTAESDFPRQRAITKWGWSSASFSELIIKDSWGGEGKEATVSLIFCVLGVTIGNVGQPWSILCQRFVAAVMDFNRVWTREECLEIIPVQKLKRSNALLYSFYPSTIILYFFFFLLREMIVMILQACRPTLFLEGSCRRFIMSWNTEPEQRTTESLTLSSSK